MNKYKGTANAGKSSFNLSYIINHKTLKDFSKEVIKGSVISGQDIESSKTFTETSQFITAIRYFPINLTKFLPSNLLLNKPINISSKQTIYEGYEIPSHPIIQLPNGVFVNYKTITKISQFYFNKEEYSFVDVYRNSYKLWLPFYRYVDLEINKLLDKWLSVYLDIDFSNGDTTYYLTISDNENTSFEDSITINTYSFQMYMNIPLGRNSAEKQELEASRIGTDTIVKSVVGGLATLVSMALPGTSGIVMGALTGLTTAGNVYSGVSNMLHETALNTAIGGGVVTGNVSSWNNSRECFILKVAQDEIPNYEEGFRKQMGRLLNEERLLGDLTGFSIISSVRLDNLQNATKKEIDEIKDILSKGVIL